MSQPGLPALALAHVETIVDTMAAVALANERYFADLDGAAGDADFGVSLASGFRAVRARWDTLDRSSVGGFLIAVGSQITSHVGGCSGPIWGTAFLRAGLEVRGRETITRDDLVIMGRAAIEGMMARGGASLGDKTLLDAVAPAVEAIARCEDADLRVALRAAADAAGAQVEATRGWIARRGRQSFTGDRSRDTLDPGIVAVATMMTAVCEALAAPPAAPPAPPSVTAGDHP